MTEKKIKLHGLPTNWRKLQKGIKKIVSETTVMEFVNTFITYLPLKCKIMLTITVCKLFADELLQMNIFKHNLIILLAAFKRVKFDSKKEFFSILFEAFCKS